MSKAKIKRNGDKNFWSKPSVTLTRVQFFIKLLSIQAVRTALALKIFPAVLPKGSLWMLRVIRWSGPQLLTKPLAAGNVKEGRDGAYGNFLIGLKSLLGFCSTAV